MINLTWPSFILLGRAGYERHRDTHFIVQSAVRLNETDCLKRLNV